MQSATSPSQPHVMNPAHATQPPRDAGPDLLRGSAGVQGGASPLVPAQPVTARLPQITGANRYQLTPGTGKAPARQRRGFVTPVPPASSQAHEGGRMSVLPIVRHTHPRSVARVSVSACRIPRILPSSAPAGPHGTRTAGHGSDQPPAAGRVLPDAVRGALCGPIRGRTPGLVRCAIIRRPRTTDGRFCWSWAGEAR